MNNDELNKYIKHYLEEDKTHSAILLTAPWGTGKSYYIQNALIPFIDSQKKKNCILVSLYGLKDLQELSKAIYMEVRAKALIKKSEKFSAGKLFAKTIVKGVASFFNIDLSMSEADLQKLYDSIDLSGKLIILEDLERTNINIIDILGYVNSLVEQDKIKVLLVANEDEIIKYENKDANEQDKKSVSVLTERVKKYLAEKEKTIGDTIWYTGEIKEAIKNIMISYNNAILNALLKDDNEFGKCSVVDEIYNDIMWNYNIKCENLRSFIYACQKTVDIFESVDNSIDIDFAKKTFMSIIAFSLRKKQNENVKWNNREEEYSHSLGTYHYPLLDYCYKNIVNQYYNLAEFKDAEKNYIEQRELERKLEFNNSYLRIIYNYYLQSENEVVEAVNQIKELLQNTNDIDVEQYGKLANYLISIKYTIGNFDGIDECLNFMIENAAKANIGENSRAIFYHDYLSLDSNDAATEFQTFKQKLLGRITQKQKTLFDFDYTVEHMSDFQKQVLEKEGYFHAQKAFARKIDNDKLVQMLIHCSAEQIYEVSGIYKSIYSFSNIKDFFADDKNSIMDLKQKIDELIQSSTITDKIKVLQLNWFIKALDDILDRL